MLERYISVLVLDEATSSLDTETERGVMKTVSALQGKKTILIVAHRLSTIEHCDYLFQLDKDISNKVRASYSIPQKLSKSLKDIQI